MATAYKLDAHCESILEEYRTQLPLFRRQEKLIVERIRQIFDEVGLLVASIESRVKTEESLAGKLELKGGKYKSLADITDIVGVRVITFYIDDVDKVASAVERLFEVDWDNSVDKRKSADIDSFGYLSLHLICQMPDAPYRFEIQMRTVLQHAWANMNHDTGYKSGVEIPKRYVRNMSRLAGMLELVDEQFSQIRTELTDYRRRIRSLVASGNLDEVPIDTDTFRSFLEMEPFAQLNRRIAAINQAEIQEVSLMSYLKVFLDLGFKTLGDISRLITGYWEFAYQIACYQMGLTDLDIISSTIGPQNLCFAYILKNGGGKPGIKRMLDTLGGESESNAAMAAFVADQANEMPFMNQ